MSESLRDTMKDCTRGYLLGDPTDRDTRTADLVNTIFNALNISGMEQSESRNVFVLRKRIRDVEDTLRNLQNELAQELRGG